MNTWSTLVGPFCVKNGPAVWLITSPLVLPSLAQVSWAFLMGLIKGEWPVPATDGCQGPMMVLVLGSFMEYVSPAAFQHFRYTFLALFSDICSIRIFY